jgi:hypothetical protein
MKATLVLVGLFSVIASCCMTVAYMEPSDGGTSAQYITRGIMNATKQ